jgi:hypothetical protein
LSAPFTSTPPPPPAAAAEGPAPDPLWPAIQSRLLSLIFLLADYPLLAQEQLWRASPQGLANVGGAKGSGGCWGSGGGAGQGMLQLIRSCGVHPHAQELQPAVNMLVSCLVDRLKAAPGEMGGVLGQLWNALGLTQPASAVGAAWKTPNSSSRGSSRGGRSALGQHLLGPEQVLGFSCVLGLWQQLPGPGARGQLWRQVQGHLLPALEEAAELLAYAPAAPASSSSSSGSSNSSSGISSGSSSGSIGELLSHVLLVSGLVEVYVRSAPRGVDVGQELTSRGILRSLTLLFAKYATGVAATPLR